MLPHIHTNDALTVVVKGRPLTVANSDDLYQEAVDLLQNGTETQFEELFERKARKFKAVTLGTEMIYSGGVIVYKGEVLHNYAADRLVTMIEAGSTVAPMVNFLAKLQANPSKRVVDHLYAFLEHGNIPLTPDGDFLAYKAVRADYKDIHSGTFYNGVGAKCTMPRNRVDEDPNRTCSAGLHVCSFDYLPHFSHAYGHVMLCKVNPANVVAIPADYNNTKMRVSEYIVVGEVVDYYAQARDVLGEAGNQSGTMDVSFTIFDGDDEEFTKTYTFEEAKIQASKAFESSESDDPAYVEDSEGFVVWEHDEFGGRSFNGS